MEKMKMKLLFAAFPVGEIEVPREMMEQQSD